MGEGLLIFFTVLWDVAFGWITGQSSSRGYRPSDPKDYLHAQSPSASFDQWEVSPGRPIVQAKARGPERMS